MSLPIRRFLDVSTEHLPSHERDYLDVEATRSAPLIPICTKTTSGWWVYAYGPSDKLALDTYQVPDRLREILIFANSRNCAYVLFDNEAPLLEGFPTGE